MSIFVVGGDFLGKIPAGLEKSGFTEIRHFQGRKILKKKNFISSSIDLVLVLTDYVGTDLSRVIKKEAKKNRVEVAFAKRSWADISRVLSSQGYHICN